MTSTASRPCWRASSCSRVRDTARLADGAIVSLDQLVTDALTARHAQIAAQQLEVRTTLGPVRVAGSETLLARMVENVIENSVRHNQPHGFINIACENIGGAGRLVVESGGPVLDEHSVAQLAQPFRRLGVERTGSQNGHGLGLSIVAAVADAHDGALELHARPQGGLRVQTHLAIRHTSARALGAGMRVLVVEDEPEFANLIAEGLRDQGMAVDIAYDGLAGASRLNINPYDVVVLDRDLPGVHGDTLCRMITGSHDPAMILMLTAAGSPAERVAGLALGADDYLAKPFHFPELVLRIRALARRKPAAQDRTLTAAGIQLDPLARIATRAGRQLDLSAKEFAVLEALLRASPGALSAERLLEQAWDENADPFTNTVRVTIGRLRRKLGEPNIIQNAPGIGYRIT